MTNAELINKQDAIHAVLHNTGDAAVAAVQEIPSAWIKCSERLRAYIRARKEDKRRMVKYYCDLCGQEIADGLPYGRRVRRFVIKELRWNEGGNKKEWQEIIAHDDCIKTLMREKCEAHETKGNPKC